MKKHNQIDIVPGIIIAMILFKFFLFFFFFLPKSVCYYLVHRWARLLLGFLVHSAKSHSLYWETFAHGWMPVVLQWRQKGGHHDTNVTQAYLLIRKFRRDICKGYMRENVFSCSVMSTLCDLMANQDPLSMEFPRQKYWSGLPCHLPEDPSDPGIEPASPVSPALKMDPLVMSHWGSPWEKIEFFYSIILSHTRTKTLKQEK